MDLGDLIAKCWQRHVFEYVPSVNTLWITKKKNPYFAGIVCTAL